MPKPQFKQYLGDGVYADYDERDGGIILTTENGISRSNIIYMEPQVLEAFDRYRKWLREQE